MTSHSSGTILPCSARFRLFFPTFNSTVPKDSEAFVNQWCNTILRLDSKSPIHRSLCKRSKNNDTIQHHETKYSSVTYDFLKPHTASCLLSFDLHLFAGNPLNAKRKNFWLTFAISSATRLQSSRISL